MNSWKTRKLLKAIIKNKTMTASQIISNEYDEDDIYSCPYIDIVSKPLTKGGRFYRQASDVFAVNDMGFDFLEEYEYKDKPIFISWLALGISALALIKSCMPEIIRLLQWIRQVLG